MTMPKIVERVKKAYQKTGMKVTTGTYYKPGNYACPIGAIAHAEHPEIRKLSHKRRNLKIVQLMEEEFGAGYMGAFAAGFDGMWSFTPINAAERRGFRHGQLLNKILNKGAK